MVSLPSGAPASSVPLAISMGNTGGHGSLTSCACSQSVLLGPYRMGLGPVGFLAICFSTLLTTAVNLSHSQSWQFSSSSQRTEASHSPQHRGHRRSRTCVYLWVRRRTARGDLILFRGWYSIGGTSCEQNTLARHIFSHLHALISMSHVTLAQGVLRASRNVIMRLVVRLI